jgi:uncharacterized protein
VFLFWIGLLVVCLPGLFVTGWGWYRYQGLIRTYMHFLLRIFQEKPLFVIPRGQPLPEAEEVRFPTSNGLWLRGCYIKGTRPRRGVILFGIEFGANRWSCRSYCDFLVEAGFDVFAFDPRNQGDSDQQPGYDPLQWLTEYEVADTHAALAYLKSRPDADPRGVGFFGISKGGNAGLLAASQDSSVLCCVTDGTFGTYSVMVPYIRRWFRLYNPYHSLQDMFPDWYYGKIGRVGLRRIEQLRHCRFPDLEQHLGQISPRPLLMIHGEADTYVKPEMARALFDCARQPSEFWLVKDAKHNHALLINGEEYRARVLRFFEQHLAAPFESVARTSERVDFARDPEPAAVLRHP